MARDCESVVDVTVNVLATDATERPKLPESFEEDTWKKLQASVRAVHQQRPVDQSFEELYKVVVGPLTRLCSLLLPPRCGGGSADACAAWKPRP